MASLVSGPWEAVCCGTFDATTPDEQRRSLWRRGTVNEPEMTKDIALTAAPSRWTAVRANWGSSTHVEARRESLLVLGMGKKEEKKAAKAETEVRASSTPQVFRRGC